MALEPTVIYLPQKLSKIASKVGLLFIETVAVPAALIAIFAHHGQAILGIAAVFAWRILFFGTRWKAFRIVPATSILTFAVLSARTGMSFTMGAAGASEAALVAYLLPAALISCALGAYFVWQGFVAAPITLKLAQDFIDIPPDTRSHLLPFARVGAWVWGSFHLVGGLVGAGVVLRMDEATAGLLSSALSVGTPIAALTLTLALCSYMGLKTGTRVALRQTILAPLADSSKP